MGVSLVVCGDWRRNYPGSRASSQPRRLLMKASACTRGNIALLLDGRWVTPPLRCGLLDGIGREMALKEGRLHEAVVRLDDLPRVQALAFINSLRGWLDARLPG
jgi:hypothetical protein